MINRAHKQDSKIKIKKLTQLCSNIQIEYWFLLSSIDLWASAAGGGPWPPWIFKHGTNIVR